MTIAPIKRDEESAEFFDAAAQGVLLLRWSAASGRYLPPAAAIDPVAPTSPPVWRPSSGLGEIVTWTVIPGRDAPDTVVAVVELEEGPWITVQVQDIDPAGLRAGHPVRIGFETPEGGEAVPIALPRT
ncbi:hypothetical protein GCM10029978_079860 [Actinoallomurus acanthiterrae]